MVQATVKKSIKPLTFTVEVSVSKVNENGTFSGVIAKVINQPKGLELYTSIPPMAGGAVYFKTESLKGIEIIEGDTPKTPVEKKKLF